MVLDKLDKSTTLYELLELAFRAKFKFGVNEDISQNPLYKQAVEEFDTYMDSMIEESVNHRYPEVKDDLLKLLDEIKGTSEEELFLQYIQIMGIEYIEMYFDIDLSKVSV